MVTYGGMSMRPVTIPTSAFIFNDIQLKVLPNWFNRCCSYLDFIYSFLLHYSHSLGILDEPVVRHSLRARENRIAEQTSRTREGAETENMDGETQFCGRF
jgi:hypothetical protein